MCAYKIFRLVEILEGIQKSTPFPATSTMHAAPSSHSGHSKMWPSTFLTSCRGDALWNSRSHMNMSPLLSRGKFPPPVTPFFPHHIHFSPALLPTSIHLSGFPGPYRPTLQPPTGGSAGLLITSLLGFSSYQFLPETLFSLETGAVIVIFFIRRAWSHIYYTATTTGELICWMVLLSMIPGDENNQHLVVTASATPQRTWTGIS